MARLQDGCLIVEIPFTKYSDFENEFRWNQGEHLAAIAPTGAGKTTLFKQLMPLRKYNIMFGTKPADKLYDEILKTGYRRIESIDEVTNWHHNYLLWPKMQKTIPASLIVQRAAFRHALDVIVRQKAWTVWIDESKYLSEMLKLKTELTYCLEQLRSIDATIVVGAQRPAWIPPSALSNATHVFLWKTTDRNDQIKLADIGGIDAREVRDQAKRLGDHEFLYIRSRGTQSKIIRSQVRT
jgi:energy-coupling factor transporter ATP-binding protein EcfA2